MLFVHGAGLRGRDAWPNVDSPDAVFADLGEGATVDEQSRAIAALVTEPTAIAAHSLGAVPTALALRSVRHFVTRLVFVEPALYDLARGNPSVERHIAAMDAAHDRAVAGDLQGFWSLVRPVMFGGDADPAAWNDERGRAEWFASVPRPWGHGIVIRDVAGVPTTVVSGAWNAEYEAIAEVLVGAGADHVVIEGHGHRPQDDPRFAAVIAA